MAITFEDKSNSNRTIIIVFLVIAILAVAGYFAWNTLMNSLPPIEVPQTVNEDLNDDILTDERINGLELFPDIPPSTVPARNSNPFVAGDAISTSTAATDVLNGAESLEPNLDL
jgi:flagellar basal body-associated protein FliL